MSLITRNAKEYRRQSKYDCTINVTKCTQALPSGFSVLRHPNHLLLAGANNRNVFITYRFLTCVAGAWKQWLKERTGGREGDTLPFFLVPTTSKRLLRRLTDSSPGAPNDGMLSRTPEVSQMVFTVLWKPVWLIWSCPKNYLSVWMSQGNFGRHEGFRWLFRLIRKCQLPLWVQSKV